MTNPKLPKRTDFIRAIVADDLEADTHGGRVVTRFPPEPNGYLHIGHATSVVLNFGIAAETRGTCHLRFDDTNPETEDERYVQSITEDVRWLGFDPGEHIYHASDYFDEMYALAEFLIEEGSAYVEDASEDEVRAARGTVTEPGRPTPSRDRSPDENLDLFRRMRAGEFPNGSRALRAKIDLAAPNMLLRDPVLYRIRHVSHYRTGDSWCIYPLYDFAHSIEDAIECVTHSFCTLEFENNRPLYDWVVDGWLRFNAARGEAACRPRQYEFARNNLDFTVTSKRKLLELVSGGHVSGWDDPRMPTVAGMRRRGIPPEAIRTFCEMVGIGRVPSRADIGKLEYATRDHLNRTAPRVLCVLRPLRLVIENYPEGGVEWIEAPYFPHDVEGEGTRELPFSRILYIEGDDFAEDPPKGWRRLAPGVEVRLRYGYFITCTEVVKDEAGEIVELRCTYDPETRGGASPDGRKVNGTIHWVSAEQSIPCEVRLYDRLFTVPDPDTREEEFKSFLNPESLITLTGARIEPSVQGDAPGSRYQFERQGYFCIDGADSSEDRLVVNRTVTLRDTWAKRAAGGGTPAPERKKASRQEKKDGGSPAPQRKASPPPRSPELEARRARYVEALGLAGEEAEILTRDTGHADLFEGAVETGASPQGAANWVIHELPRELGGRTLLNLPFAAADLGALVKLVEGGELSSSGGREVLAEMIETGGHPSEIVEAKGLRQQNDPDALEPIVERLIAENPGKVAAYRGGKTGLMGFFMGQVMRETGGAANPEIAKKLLGKALDGS